MSAVRLRSRRAGWVSKVLCAWTVLLPAVPAAAQMTLSTAVSLAVKNSPRVQLAMDDLRRAHAVASEAKDVFIPNAVIGGGAGDSYGITLTVPTIFTVSSQSLVYSSAQRFYLRSSRMGVQAAQFALQDVRAQVEEEAVLTYLALVNASQTAELVHAEYAEADALRAIVQQRFDAGLENDVELNLARRQVLAIRLQQMQLDDDIALQQARLASIMGVAADTVRVVPESVPDLQLNLEKDAPTSTTVAERAAVANAESRQERAKGDASYRWKPQVGFAAQYGRISPINNVSDYYNLRGKYNVAFAGVQIQLPLFDAAHQARAQQAAADASRARHELQITQAQQNEAQLQTRHLLAELTVRSELAQVDLAIAEAQLKATSIQTKQGGDGGPVLNPKDLQNARLRSTQRALDVQDAHFQVKKAQVTLLRITDGLESWLQQAATIRMSPAATRP